MTGPVRRHHRRRRTTGLKVFPTLSHGPAWATEPDGDGIPNNNTPRPGSIRSSVRRWRRAAGGKITHFGLWNEPNLAGFLKGR